MTTRLRPRQEIVDGFRSVDLDGSPELAKLVELAQDVMVGLLELGRA